MSIHPTAIIDPSASIADQVSIGPYTVVGPEVKIGKGSILGSHVTIEYTTLGEACQIYPHAAIGFPGQHLGYKGEPARVEVGNGTIFREGVTVHRGTNFDQSVTKIGNNCFFMATSHVAHDCRIGNNVIMANGTVLGGHVEVGDNAFISGLVAVHQHCRVGKGAIVSGGAMVSQDAPPFCIAQGDRAEVRGLNMVGLRRLGYDRKRIQEIKNAYAAVFLSGQSLQEALSSPDLNTGSEPIDVFREFLKSAKRGFIRAAKNSSVNSSNEALI